MRTALIFLINLYRKYISPLKAPCCRFQPTCSEYAIGAIREWGALCGLGLIFWRVLRCNPFSRGGDDPVPPCPYKGKVKAFFRRLLRR